MSNEIVVRKYEDLETFFDKMFPELELSLNNLFLEEINKGVELSNKSSNLSDVANKVINTAAIANQLKPGEPQLQAILTPEMRKALADGTAKLCVSHEDGQVFPKIQYLLKKKGESKFIRLEEINRFPKQNFTNVMMLANQMQILQKLDGIQNFLIDFSKTTYRQLSEIQDSVHRNRMQTVDELKSMFNYFFSGESTKSDLRNYKIHALESVKTDIAENLERLEYLDSESDKIKISFFAKEKEIEAKKRNRDEKQQKMEYIYEGIIRLHQIEIMEIYIEWKSYADKYTENGFQETEKIMAEKIGVEIDKPYSKFLIEQFTQDKLNLLCKLNVSPQNFWFEKFEPLIHELKAVNKEETLTWKKCVLPAE